MLNRIPTTPGNAFYESEIDGRFVFATEGKVGLRTSLDQTRGLLLDRWRRAGAGRGRQRLVLTEINVTTSPTRDPGASGRRNRAGLTVMELEASGIPVDFSGDPGPDADGDGTSDANDNCSDVANASQLDADHDGFGNACDADYDGDGAVTGLDLGVLRAAYLSQAGGPRWNAAVDHDGDGLIGPLEIGFFRASFLAAPGPSGLACAGTASCSAP